MYKALLVDDEQWALADVKNLVDWEAHGFRIVAEASSGAEGLMLANVHKPDLIVSDIRMPGMNGLEMYRQLGSAYKSESITLLISAHNEFDYVREALKLGVSDYILKPIKQSELTEALVRARGLLDELQRKRRLDVEYMRSQSFVDLLVGAHSPGNLSRRLSAMGLLLSTVCCRVFVVKVTEGDPSAELGAAVQDWLRPWPEVSYVLARLGMRKWAVVLNVDTGSGAGGGEETPARKERVLFCQLLRGYRRRFEPGGLQAGGSMCIRSIAHLPEAYRQAEAMARQDFVAGPGGLHFYRKQAGSWFDEGLGQILAADLGRLQHLAAGLGRPHRYLNVEGATQLYYAFLMRSAQLRGQQQEKEGLADQDPAYAFPSLAALADAVQALLREQQEGTASAKRLYAHAIVQEMAAQIEANYGQKLMIGSFAEQYHLHPNYLSTLFKQEAGEPFTSRLVRVRMDKAAELLRGSQMPLHEISEHVGYDDYFQFSKLFKKHKQLSPIAYRKCGQ